MPRRKKENLMMKFRVKVLWRMPKSESVRLLQRAIRTGIVPAGIEIESFDWGKGKGKSYREGEIDPADWEALQRFYGAMKVADIRAERV